MPELPDVEHFRRVMEDHLKDRRLERVWAENDEKIFEGITPENVALCLRGRTVGAAHRRGKFLWLELDRPPHPIFHFGMTGDIVIYQDPAQRPEYAKLEMVTAEGEHLAVISKRRLGRITLRQNPAQQEPIAEQGSDPLIDLPSTGELEKMLRKRSTAIKGLLMDQSFLAGVGNWTADETLYQAGIDPHHAAKELTHDQVKRLRQKLKYVMEKAVEKDADYSALPGSWLFHHRGKEQSLDGRAVKRESIGGRTSYWVPGAQK